VFNKKKPATETFNRNSLNRAVTLAKKDDDFGKVEGGEEEKVLYDGGEQEGGHGAVA